MIIPIRTDYQMRSRPWVNYALVAANILIFVAGYSSGSRAAMARIWDHMLWPDRPEMTQFFTSMFLHGDFWHLSGNMVFLWVFGNALNDRFGHVAYLAFYLAGGVIAGVGYILLSGSVPVLGASGAISAVTGAYLVLLPRVRVTLLVWFYIIYTFEVTSLLFIGFNLVLNLVLMAPTLSGYSGGGGVAYSAHVAGYLFGLGAALAMLGTRLVPRDAFDLLGILQQRHRRGKYRRMVSRGYDPFNYGRAGHRGQPQQARWVQPTAVSTATADTPQARETQLRRDIAADLSRGDTPSAARKYLQLIQIADSAVLSKQNQLDVANQLMASEQYPAAADAYERFLRHYPSYEYRGDILLMVGLIYGRYLHQNDLAARYLSEAVENLHESGKLEMARQELAAVQGRR